MEAALGTDVSSSTHILNNSTINVPQSKNLPGVPIELCHPTLSPHNDLRVHTPHSATHKTIPAMKGAPFLTIFYVWSLPSTTRSNQ